MGKAEIISHSGNGLYNLKVRYNRDRYNALIAAINAKIAVLVSELSDAKTDVEEKQAVLDGLTSYASSVAAILDGLTSEIESYNDLLAKQEEELADLVEQQAAQEAIDEKSIEIAKTQSSISNAVSEIEDIDTQYENYSTILSTQKATLIDLEEQGATQEQITAQEALIAETQTDIDAIQTELNSIYDQHESIIAETKPLEVELQFAITNVNNIELDINSLQQRKESLGKPEDEIQQLWCADLTENVKGNTGTVEVIGECGTLQLRPGYVGQAKYDTVRDGQLHSTSAMSAAQTFYNKAMMPGWQKWRPTFKHGTITAISDDGLAAVTLDATTSREQGLGINQAPILSDVEFQYMTCGHIPFIEGDNVLVKFIDQAFDKPVIVGFRDNPRPCSKPCGIFGSTDSIGEFEDPNFTSITHGFPSDSSNFLTEIPDDQKDWNNSWMRGMTVQVGADWEYPYQFDDGTFYQMQVTVEAVIVTASGQEYIIPMLFTYDGKNKTTGGPGFTAKLRGEPLAYNPFWYSPKVESDCAFDFFWDYSGSAGDLGAQTFRFDVNGLNDIRLWAHVYYYHWINLHDEYKACREEGERESITHVLSPYSEDSSSVVAGEEPIGIAHQNILNCTDPVGGMTAEQADNLYTTQSWSMSGVISANGVVLTDSTEAIDLPSGNAPFGPWTPWNAGTGDKTIAVPPITERHHVAFRVKGIKTDDGFLAFVATGDHPNFWTLENSTTCDSFGSMNFYFTITGAGVAAAAGDEEDWYPETLPVPAPAEDPEEEIAEDPDEEIAEELEEDPEEEEEEAVYDITKNEVNTDAADEGAADEGLDESDEDPEDSEKADGDLGEKIEKDPENPKEDPEQVDESVEELLTGDSNIIGNIKDRSMANLENIKVGVYRKEGTGDNVTYSYVTSTTTAADGTYTLSGLSAGTYKLKFSDPDGVYITEYYSDAYTLDTATDIVVADSTDVTSKNATLGSASTISGAVTT